jgi:uncharacterized protein (TIGR02099 family)
VRSKAELKSAGVGRSIIGRYNNALIRGLKRIKAFTRTLFRFAAFAVMLVLLAFASLVLWLRYAAFPSIDSYRPYIVSSIEKASGMRLTVESLSAGWGGLRPVVQLHGLRIEDRRGKAAFQLERAEVQLAWWALFLGQVRFADVDFYRPQLSLRRGADGVIYLADKAINTAGSDEDGAFTEWLLAQPSLGVHDATLTWRDEKVGAPEVRLSNVQIELRKDLGHHRAALTAVGPPGLAGRIDFRADVRLRREDGLWRARGSGYAEARDADLGRLRAHLPVPETLRSGIGSVRLWAQFTHDGVDELVADLAMRDARAQLAEDSLPLELAGIAGRARYKAQQAGFTFATEGLRFRLPSGVEAQPGNFSLTRTSQPGKAPRTDVQADGIDLKIATALVDYFPIPRDLKARVLRFAPRGRLMNASVMWSGDPSTPARTYALRGRFQDLAVNAVDTMPGVSGLDGEIEGTEAGGTLRFTGRKATFEQLHVFREPLAIDTLEARVRWRHEGAALVVDIDDARFANADAEGRAAGSWRSLPEAKEPSPGYVDIKGSLTRATATSVAKYLPNRSERLRDWLERSIQAGESNRATFELKGNLREFPFGDPSAGHFLVEGDIKGGSLRYHPDWPGVEAIDGTLRLENRRIEIRAKSATIFASRATQVSAVIEDLAVKPALLTIDGDVDTTGADSMRFLRQSPLANGPGAFTRAVSVEGPGRLRLHLEFPLGAGESARVAGEYQFNGATATAARGLVLANVQGKLAFTEKSVRAPELTGSLFGHPAQVTIASQPDGPVATTLQGRIDAQALAAYVPEAIAARTSGTLDWQARLLSGRAGNELSVTSDLKGLAVSLPAPLGKEAAESRPLSIHIARLGSDGEAVTTTLDGDIHGRFVRAASDRWHALLKFGAPFAGEPAREGLWLYGQLAELDVDAWQALFPRPAAGPAAAPPAVELQGFDLHLGRVRYLGREVANLRAHLSRVGEGWSGRLESPLLAGEVQWNPEGKGRVVARLARLAIPESSSQPAVAPQQPAAQRDLPAIDLAAERFDFRGRTLGRLELKAQPVGEEWHIERLDITAEHARFASTGGWRRTGAGSLTTLTLKLDADNLNALLGMFGYGDYLKRGSGALEGTLAWPGLPHDFAVANLAGSFKVHAARGQFAKIDPGAGKLLGLLSLQTLPRRASLDFRDVFSEGFAFERIQGGVKVARGVLLTDDFEISGPAAFVSIAGEISLPDEKQALTVRVVPEVSEGVALAATVFGTPVLGLSTLLVTKLLKNPLGKVVAYEYQVTGSWDNPHVERTSAPPARAQAATADGPAKAATP